MEETAAGWRSQREYSGGGVWEWGSHMIDWILNLVNNRVDSVVSYYHKVAHFESDVEDHMDIHLQFSNGMTASIQILNCSPLPKPMWHILGDKGVLLLNHHNDRYIQIWSNRTHNTDVKYYPICADQRQLFYENIVMHLTESQPLLITPYSARRVVAILETANISAATGEKILISDNVEELPELKVNNS